MIMGKHKFLVPEELHPKEAVPISSTEHAESFRLLFMFFFIHLTSRTPFFQGFLEVRKGSSLCFSPVGIGKNRDRKMHRLRMHLGQSKKNVG